MSEVWAYVVAGWVVVGAVLALYVGWLRARIRRADAEVDR